MSEQMYVRDVMTPLTQQIKATQPMMTARQRMQGDMRLKSLIVVDDNNVPVGMVRYADVHLNTVAGGTIADIMVTDVPTARDNQPLDEVAGLMSQYDVDRLIVVDDAGMTIGELPRAALTLSETSSHDAPTTHETLSDANAQRDTPAFDVQQDMAVVGNQGAKLGKVKEVLSDSLSGSLTHIVVHAGMFFGKDRAIPADLIESVADDAVHLKIDKTEFNMLPDLQANA